MLRYFFFKLSGFTGKKDFSISSSCNHMLKFRTATSLKKDTRRDSRRCNVHVKPQLKRSYSFPTRVSKNRFLEEELTWKAWNRTDSQECRGLSLVEKKSYHRDTEKVPQKQSTCSSPAACNDTQPFSTSVKRKKKNRALPRNKYNEAFCYGESERYELEAAKPRKSQSELIFNVLDYIDRDVDLTDYLQPSNLRPFGSHDNIYLPLLMNNKNLDAPSHDNPNYMQTMSEIPIVIQKAGKNNAGKEGETKAEEEVQINKVKKESLKPYKEIIRKHKELDPIYVSKPSVSKEKNKPAQSAADSHKPSVDSSSMRNTISKSLDRPLDAERNEMQSNFDFEPFEYRNSFVYPSLISIEPPPFLAKREEMFPMSFSDIGFRAKRNIANYSPVQPPWPSYSDRIKSLSKRSLVTYPAGYEDNCKSEIAEDAKHQSKSNLTKQISDTKSVIVEDVRKTSKRNNAFTNLSQLRSMSTERVPAEVDAQASEAIEPRKVKSSTFVLKNIGKTPIVQSSVSLNNNTVNISPSYHYAKSSSSNRKLEPKPCGQPEKKKKCFLPSKIRLKPPPCITKPKPCVLEQCPPRADDCLKELPKKLPAIETKDCECVEPLVPYQNPKLKRLKMKFVDEPRVCPCEPICKCPEAPVRADSCAEEKVKRLSVYKPGKCECIEPPRLVDVPLKRLEKVCPTEVCFPERKCPVESCEDKFRADMCLVEKPKSLPKIRDSPCECLERHVPYENPKMRRLNLKCSEEPRMCPCVPTICPCPPPVRADDLCAPKEKKLRPHVAKECVCIEPPRLVDVPLIRLQKCCDPEVCNPPRICKEETCEDRERADDCLVEHPKKLRPIESKPCPCVETRMADGPKLKRLCLDVPEPPRICPPIKTCPPEDCARADDCVPEKVKKLRPIVPGECPCIEQTIVDVEPFPRLKCREEPECLYEDPCETEYPRADYGCWEYEVCAPSDNCEKKCKKKKDVNYKQNRKFNTDSRATGGPDTGSGEAIRAIENSNRKPNQKVIRLSKYSNNISEADVKDVPQESRHFLHGNKSATLPRLSHADKTNTSKLQKANRPAGTSVDMKRNNSLPTILLLKDLKEFEAKGPNNDAILLKTDKLYCKLNPTPKLQQSTFLNNNVRKLSTITAPSKEINCRPGIAQASSKSNDNQDENSGCNYSNRKPCPKMERCQTVVLKNCPAKSHRGCKPQKMLVCCQKKTVPNPAFSECMEEEIAPYSDTAQWRCNRKEYGYDPNQQKAHEPLDTVKEKKKFSTSVAHRNTSNTTPGGNAVVDYFSARYPKAAKPKRNNSSNCNLNFSRDMKTDSSMDKTSIDSVTTTEELIGDHLAHREARTSKLLNKSDTTCGDRKMSTRSRGRGTLQFNSSSLLCSHAIIDHTILKKNMSTLNRQITMTKTMTEPQMAPHRRQYVEKYNFENPSNKETCKKKNGCGPFKLENCPERSRYNCKHVPPQVVCNQKPLAPYPSFSELINDDMEEKLTECPMEKEKLQHLQPKYPIPLHKPELIPPVEPLQGKIDPKLEESCIRERLCLTNEGLTQDCSNFGHYIKPMKSRDFIKQRNTECEKIEELKRQGKWPSNHSNDPHQRKFSTTSCESLYAPRRNYSRSAHSSKTHFKKDDHTCAENQTMNPRDYHAPCKQVHPDAAEEEIKEPVKCQMMVQQDQPCKYTKLKNVQWRINNFQKWHRLNKMNNVPHSIKKYHTCSKLKYRKFVRYSHVKYFNTTVSEFPVENSTVSVHRGIPCSKLNQTNDGRFVKGSQHLQQLNAYSKKHLSGFYRRGISTSKVPRKKKIVRFPVYPKPIKNCLKYSMPNNPKPVRPVRASPSSNNQRKHTDTDHKAQNNKTDEKCLQPKYPSVPEIDTSCWEECNDYVPEPPKTKGKSFDCSAVKHPFIRLNSDNLEPVRSSTCEYAASSEKEEIVPCTACGEVFMPNSRSYMRSNKNTYSKPPRSCPKFPLPKQRREVPEEKDCPTPTSSKIAYPASVLNLWEKIVNYFKARPNCPSPEEWKKKALREKAEKAAKAAGLCLCDPNDIPQKKKTGNGECSDSNEGKPGRKIRSDCFPARRNPCKISNRCYSSRVKWDIKDDLLEKEEKQMTEKGSKSFTEDVHFTKDCDYQQEDVNQKYPDPMLENLFNEALLSRDSFSCLEENYHTSDPCISYSFKILHKNGDVSDNDDNLSESLDEVNKFNQNKAVSDFQEYFSKMDVLSDFNCEEMEKNETQNLIKEFEDLLQQNQKPPKKN